MKYIVTIPASVDRDVRAHLLQNNLEQGAFLFARVSQSTDTLTLAVVDAYLVPPEGWDVQHNVYLEMSDEERARIMKRARDAGTALIDCHSHPDSGSGVAFSPSDRHGITQFAAYAKWKLDGKPYTALVYGEASLDAVAWYGDFRNAQPLDEVRVLTEPATVWTPRGTWFHRKYSAWEYGDG